MSGFAPDRDLSKLDETFRERVHELVRAMKARGYDAWVFEGWRSFERAAELQRRGKGKARSMHCYGLAADILSSSKLWAAPESFWIALSEEAKRLGLTWGGDFKTRSFDYPHVQALPGARDTWVQHASKADIAREVAEHLAWSDPDRRITVKDDSTDKVEVPGPPKPPSVFPRGGRPRHDDVGTVDQGAPTPVKRVDWVDPKRRA